jgi:ABC-2 type transport system permease protein
VEKKENEMDHLNDVLWIEFRKVFRSKVPVISNLGFLIAPLMVGLMMFVYRDPDFAKKIGILSMKAEVIGGKADWPSYIGILIAVLGTMGIFLFSLIESWIFGREFVEGTLKDMLAVPISRRTIVVGKFIVTAATCILMAVELVVVSYTIGYLLKLPLGTPTLLINGASKIILAAVLVLLANTPFALMASIGKGYLLPLGMTMLALVFANVVSVLGWGEFFPWYIPSILSGMAAEGAKITIGSYAVVILTAIIGILATMIWWMKADHQQ